MYVRAKKALGQHFLKDLKIAQRIVEILPLPVDLSQRTSVLEVGPGTGVLTQYLLNENRINPLFIEVDKESIKYLRATYPSIDKRLIEGDFLKTDLSGLFSGEFFIIGNFPYNISSQILFKVLDYKEQIPVVVGMFQKEVAMRIASPPGNKDYGILSVLLQAWYYVEYLFTVDEGSFLPPPKVKSAVIRVTRNSRESLGCDEILFKKIVKATFNQRRKTIRNSIKAVAGGGILKESPLLALRPEQLSVEQFVELTNLFS